MEKKGKPSYDNPMSMKDHWKMDVSDSVFPKAKVNDPADAFLAMPGKDRPQPHKKINECDH